MLILVRFGISGGCRRKTDEDQPVASISNELIEAQT